jgi:hypothetical protein
MNFEQFLKTETFNQKSKATSEDEQEKKDQNTKHNKAEKQKDLSDVRRQGKNRQKRYNFEKLNALDADKKQFREEKNDELFNANEFLFKKGDFVKIIRTPRKEGDTQVRLCDIYMGYFGEIKEFNKGSDIATVMLEATVNLRRIKIPVECLVKRYN